MDDRSDAELLDAAGSTPAAFGVFYRRHVTQILAFLVRRTDAETGADLTAETFAIALRRAGQFDGARGEPVAWLYGIARNLLALYFRTGQIERRAQRRLGIARFEFNDEELDRIERLASLDVSAEVLAQALNDLPTDQREALVARIVHEHTYAEIGAAADATPAVARQRVSRGLATLRHRLGGQR